MPIFTDPKPIKLDPHGDFADYWQKADFLCKRCGEQDLYWRPFEAASDGYAAELQHCRACGERRWLEATDA